MKKLIFYAVALLSVASLLNGCKKDDGNESKGPNVEGVKARARTSKGSSGLKK